MKTTPEKEEETELSTGVDGAIETRPTSTSSYITSLKHEEGVVMPIAEPEAPVAKDDDAKAVRLAECVHLIKGCESEAIVIQGKHLHEVHEKRLFHPKYKIFGKWIKATFGHTKQWAFQRIDAFKLRASLIEDGIEEHLIPGSELAFRELKKAKKANYKAVLELAHKSGNITGESVRSARLHLEPLKETTPGAATPKAVPFKFESYKRSFNDFTEVLKKCNLTDLNPDQTAEMKTELKQLIEQIEKLGITA